MAQIIYNIESNLEVEEKFIPKKFKHPNKNKEYFLARKALANCLGIYEVIAAFDSLELTDDFNSVKGLEQFCCSLSHTNQIAGAVLAKKSEILAVGLDIEHLDRKFPLKALRYFVNEEDQLDSYTDLEKWCIKEACFKAATGVYPECNLLKDIFIQGHTFSYNQQPSQYQQCFKLWKQADKIIVVAYIYENHHQEIEIKAL